MQLHQLGNTFFGQCQQAVHFFACEGHAFCSTLHFHKIASPRHDHIHVGVAGGVFVVIQIEQSGAIFQTDRNSGHRIQNRRLFQFALMHKPLHSILCRHKCARDTGSARTAIRLKHITVEVNGSLPQFFQIEHSTHRTANQALNFLGSATLFATRCFAIPAGVCRTWQHAIFGRYPSLAAAFFMSWHLLFHRGCAQHTGVTKFNQHGAFSMHGITTCNANSTQLIFISVMGACE